MSFEKTATNLPQFEMHNERTGCVCAAICRCFSIGGAVVLDLILINIIVVDFECVILLYLLRKLFSYWNFFCVKLLQGRTWKRKDLL